MNIFMLDSDPTFAAQYHVDKHCVKMILEYAQLMSTAHHLCGGSTDVYRATHKNHPSAIWVREGSDNYQWLYSLWQALSDEYTFRYSKVHKSWEMLSETLKQIPRGIPIGSTPLRLAMPDQYKQSDPVESYREYYIGDKKHIATWSKRNMPDWWE